MTYTRNILFFHAATGLALYPTWEFNVFLVFGIFRVTPAAFVSTHYAQKEKQGRELTV